MVASSVGSSAAQTLFDFTRNDLDNGLSSTDDSSVLWTENSDATNSGNGMSKASLVLQKSKSYQRAVLFTLLNPKNGTGNHGYAAVECRKIFNLAEFNNISIRCRARGDNVHYKMILRHHKDSSDKSLVYGQVFTAPTNEFATIKLPFGTFKPYYRGRELSPEENPLDQTAITNIGLKIDTGPYLPDNQAGVSALEIDWIKATVK